MGFERICRQLNFHVFVILNLLGWLKRPLVTQISDSIWKNLQPNVVGIICIFSMGILFSAMSWEFFQVYYFSLQRYSECHIRIMYYYTDTRKSGCLWGTIFLPGGYRKLWKWEVLRMTNVQNYKWELKEFAGS